MADAAYSRRDFAGGAVVTTLAGSISASDTSISITLATGWPSGTNGEFFVVIGKGTASEEKVRIDTRSGTTLTVTSSGRGADGTTAATHAAGESIQICTTAQDLDEANKAVAETVGKVTTAGDMIVASGANAFSRLAVGASGRMLVSSGTAPAWVAMSGDATVTSGGVVTIANDAVTAAKIADDAVGADQIADDAVGTAQIADDAVTQDQLASDSVGGAQIQAISISSTKIQAGAVGANQLAEAYKPRYLIDGWVVHSDDSAGTMAMGRMFGRLTSAVDFDDSPQVMTESGSIIGLSVVAGDARTSGTMTFEVYKNGVATGLSAVINGSNTQYVYATQATNTDTFVAGDRLEVYSTNASYGPSSYFRASILVQKT